MKNKSTFRLRLELQQKKVIKIKEEKNVSVRTINITNVKKSSSDLHEEEIIDR